MPLLILHNGHLNSTLFPATLPLRQSQSRLVNEGVDISNSEVTV